MDSTFIKISIRHSENPCNRYFFQQDKCLYSVYREKNNCYYLECINSECNCKAKIQGNEMLRTNSLVLHNHPNHEILAEFHQYYENLKIEVENSKTDVRDLHKATIRKMTREAAAMMDWENVKGTLNRIRRSKLPPCPEFKDFQELLDQNESVFNDYGTIRGKAFYSGTVEGQMFFSHPELIPALEDNLELFVDGTFSVVPYNQDQLLVIMGKLQGKPRPLIYVIMSHRTEEIYTKVFKFIKDVILPANNCFHSPINVTVDFEMAIRNAVKNVWPEINVFGCNFHFCQALRRKARSMDYLLERIENSPKHAEILMMFMRSSLLPLNMINDGIDAIKTFIGKDEELAQNFETFIEYFDFTWLGRYPPEHWCVSGQRFRTNNHIEGYNFKIKQWMPINPAPFKFLEVLQDLAFDADANFLNAKLKKIIYKDASRLKPHLKELLPQLESGIIDELEFMSKMACV